MHLREEMRFRGDLGNCSDPLSISADKKGWIVVVWAMADEQKKSDHVPVLPDQILEALAGRGPFVDCTLGAGGHLALLLETLPADALALALDRDGDMMRQTRDRLNDSRVTYVHGRFSDVERHVEKWGHRPQAVLADLGVSSMQIDNANRGFSLQREGPLDMRMDRTQELTANKLLRDIDEKTLREALRGEADERHATKLARELKAAAAAGALRTTLELSRLVESVVGNRMGRHPATKTFQALRRLVNAEGRQLEDLLSKTPQLLAVGGRFAVISFHSGEDRVVKHAFNDWERRGNWRRLTKKPIEPEAAESRRNPRARSARLRVLERIA